MGALDTRESRDAGWGPEEAPSVPRSLNLLMRPRSDGEPTKSDTSERDTTPPVLCNAKLVCRRQGSVSITKFARVSPRVSVQGQVPDPWNPGSLYK